MEKANANHSNDAAVIRGGGAEEKIGVTGYYTAECFGPDGKLKWAERIENTVTTEGKNSLLDTFLGTVAKATFYMGLISSVGWTATAAGDTAAQINGTNGWKEANTGGGTNTPTYSGTVRLTPAFAAAASGSKATSAAVAFSITGTGTVKGCFLASNSATGSTSGVLYSAGTFTGGDKAVGNGDTLNVTYTASV